MPKVSANKQAIYWLYCTLITYFALVSSEGIAQSIEVTSLDKPVSLTGLWKFQIGDDLFWSEPSFDDADWDELIVPMNWGKQGYYNYAGFAWYRITLILNLQSSRIRQSVSKLSVTLGKAHSAYELYAGGKLIGGVGGLPPNPQIRYDQYKTYEIPSEAIDDKGQLVLAVRVWRSKIIDLPSEGGFYEGSFLIGTNSQLIKFALTSKYLSLLLVIIYVLMGFYHIFLYWHSKELNEYLWFGLLAIAMGVYGFMFSQWKHIIELDYTLIKKIEFAALYIIPVLALEFYWQILAIRPKRILRLYQLSFLVLVPIVIILPGLLISFRTLRAWQIWVLPTLVGSAAMMLWYSWKGNPEARIILIGTAVLSGAGLNDIATDHQIINTPRMAPIGFAVLIFSMSISLARRITRLFSNLEQEVAQHTKELQAANKKLEQVASIDSLTQIYNRRSFLEKTSHEVARSNRTKKTFSIILADIDNFKRFNDTYGHACGDYILKEVATDLRSSLRKQDIVARWGGEEFIFLLPETSSSGAAVVAENIRVFIDSKNYWYQEQSLHISLTFGVSQFQAGLALDKCISNADEALYRGKKAGKNRVTVSE